MDGEFRKIMRAAKIDAGSSVLVAVSGGVDSLVLLDLLSRFAAEFDLGLRAFHLDHQIRAESSGDARFVSELCARLEIPCLVERVDVPELAKSQRLSLETAGREARRSALQRLAAEHGCVRIVLGHHLDDQAETFLQRLLRGTGISGLQGMSVQDGCWWRPLLSFSRQQIMDYAQLHQLDWVEDASNRDPVYLRNRIRHQLLPQLREYNPQIVPRLATLSRQFQLEEDYWQQQLAVFWPQLLLSEADGLRLDRALLLGCHPALQLRLLREGLRYLRGDLAAIESVHLEAIRELASAGRSQAELDLPGCWVARRYEQLWLRKAAPQSKGFDMELRIEEALRLPDGRVLRAEWSDRSVGEDANRVEFDASNLSFPLRVRSLLGGDRFRPSGLSGRQKIKDFLIDHKIEKEQRASLPLLVSGDEILWLTGLRRSSQAPVTLKSRQILAVRLIPAS